MLRFFLNFRIVSGMILTLSPFAGQFFQDIPNSLLIYVCYALVPSIPFWGKLLQSVPITVFRLSASAAAVSAFFLPEGTLSAALAGFAYGSVIPLCIRSTEHLFHHQSSTSHGVLWGTVLFLSAAFFQRFLQQSVPGSLLIATALGIFLLPKPALSYKEYIPSPLTEPFRTRFRKPCFFTVTITSSLCLAFLMYDSCAIRLIAFLPASSLLFWTIPASGALLAGWFIERKGIFSSCVLLIFLCESPLLCLCFPGSRAALLFGQVLLLAAAGGLPVILAVLTHYLHGPVRYTESFSRLVCCIPLGIILSLPLGLLAEKNDSSPEEPAICLFFLLVLSFFCIFFAWKQRFVILKNQKV